ncbi:MAG: DUF502 domain-containing protein [Nitrospira sp.]|jgi:uncharacterized membrane protein|nr:DUF502 domain-containing protein [Nitrospira sp.]
MSRSLWRIFATGLLLVVPAWTTYLILSALFLTLNELVTNLMGGRLPYDVPGLGLLLLVGLVLIVGGLTTHVVGQRLVTYLEEKLDQIPLVRSIYLTMKGMTDILNFRSRFGQSTVIAFPFPRDGLWALGFVMGHAPQVLQVSPIDRLLMVFVPTAIHPFTGYLAFVPEKQVHPLNLPAEDAMKIEFSAGLFKPASGWLQPPHV